VFPYKRGHPLLYHSLHRHHNFKGTEDDKIIQHKCGAGARFDIMSKVWYVLLSSSKLCVFNCPFLPMSSLSKGLRSLFES
jgi:hypothetical protein